MKIKGFMCTTDWTAELPLGANDVVIFTSIAALKKKRGCYPECGIVEVTLTKTRTVKKGKI